MSHSLITLLSMIQTGLCNSVTDVDVVIIESGLNSESHIYSDQSVLGHSSHFISLLLVFKTFKRGEKDVFCSLDENYFLECITMNQSTKPLSCLH